MLLDSLTILDRYKNFFSKLGHIYATEIHTVKSHGSRLIMSLCITKCGVSICIAVADIWLLLPVVLE